MKPPRRPRGLSGEDAFLWGEIARLITPLRGRLLPPRAKATTASAETAAKPAQGPKPPHGTKQASGKTLPGKVVPGKVLPGKVPAGKEPAGKAVPGRAAPPAAVRPPPGKMPPKRVLKPSPPAPLFPAPATVVTAPTLPGLERKAILGLRRGSLRVEARIDLHGMYQAEAHDALIGFLMRCRMAGHAHVLVVTGKGGGSGYDDTFSERGVLRRSVPHWLRAPELRGVVLGFEEAARHHGGAGALYIRLRRR